MEKNSALGTSSKATTNYSQRGEHRVAVMGEISYTQVRKEGFEAELFSSGE
jgi:hypothetical protein